MGTCGAAAGRVSIVPRHPPRPNRLYEEYVRGLQALGVPVETGVFRAHMEVELVNDGPVTILIDSEKTF